MGGFIIASTRLLVLNNLDEFDFIANVIPQILTADQMEVEHTHGQHSLSSTAAFIGSQGRRNSKGSKFSFVEKHICLKVSVLRSRMDLSLE
jgi:hypothetical protein